MWFGYDPLGRCVKRWESASGAPETAAATLRITTHQEKDETGNSMAGGTRRRPVHRTGEYARANLESERQLDSLGKRYDCPTIHCAPDTDGAARRPYHF